MPATLGTVKHEYGKQWIYLNPNPTQGPYAWNVANIPLNDDPEDINDIENLYTVPPIMNNQAGELAQLYFSIEDLKGRNEPDSSTRTVESNIGLLLDSRNLPPSGLSLLRGITDIQGAAPVMSRQNDRDAYLWFDISGLDPVDIDRQSRRYKVKAGYNSRSVTSLTAQTPLEVDTADGLATVSFDITTLPDA
jgi:hypothetical protein